MTGHVTGEGGHWSGHGIFTETETKPYQNISFYLETKNDCFNW